jgi:hypothetical protein
VTYTVPEIMGVRARDFTEVIQDYSVLAPATVGYLIAAVTWTAVIRIYLVHDLWQRVSGSATIEQLAAAEAVARDAPAVSALGEGLADGLDMGGL